LPTAGSSRVECNTQLISTVGINSASAVYYFIRWKNFNGVSPTESLKKQKMLRENETCHGPVWMTQNYEQRRPLSCIYWLKDKELSLESQYLCDNIGGNFARLISYVIWQPSSKSRKYVQGRGHVNPVYISNFIQLADIA